MKIALLCGGPSPERGISLNSARTVLDHLESDEIEIVPFYFDYRKKAYKISKAQLYSNTPSDFDFKLSQTATSLSYPRLVSELKKCDIAFPVMHGHFGEDGEIQVFLEKNKIPFIGTGSEGCKSCFDKFFANQKLKELDFFTLPSAVLKIYKKDHRRIITDFFESNSITKAVIKPAVGGSSIGVYVVSSPEEALEKAELLFSKRIYTRVVIEKFAEGREFTVIILQNRFGLPVAILPTEIEMRFNENNIFDFRKKYLPTNQVTYHCPPRFDNQTVETIQVQAEQLFSALEMNDFARFDGWVLPDGSIWFSDFNPISGMEQNSFLFQQSSRVGLSHHSVLLYILKRACQRNDLGEPTVKNPSPISQKPVNVLFGGQTAERQVSLMSGTNVWLKLRKSKNYSPKPFLFDLNGNVWELPYALCLNHTVEEIYENCEKAPADEDRLRALEKKAQIRLSIWPDILLEQFTLPRVMSLEEFIKNSEFVFIGLHGGMGENGILQKMFDDASVKYNGAGEDASSLLMDKYETGNFIDGTKIKGLKSASKMIIDVGKLTSASSFQRIWKKACHDLHAKSLIIKPIADGCSAGVVHLYNVNDLERYINLNNLGLSSIPKYTFKNQEETIDLPLRRNYLFMLEQFVETDKFAVRNNKLIRTEKSGVIETTIGIIEENNTIRAFNPSLTVAEGEVLSLEEKFQSGTGINITPPPGNIVSNRLLKKVKDLVVTFANKAKIEGYARVDLFINTKKEEIIIIEANTLPGLTPSTVLYQQALDNNPPIYPKDLLEKIIVSKKY